jgi:hypothetical protein
MPAKIDLETKKEIAKIGMTVALGITVVTTPFLKQNRLMKNLHTGAGVALAALGLWHHLLYQPEKRRAKAAALEAKSNSESQPAALPESTVDLSPAS